MKKLDPHSNAENDVLLNNEHVSINAALFHNRHETIRFVDGELVYQGGIAAELLCITDHYQEVTRRFEAKLDDDYRFCGDESHSNEWFHKAEFWPYMWDSADNIYHYIRATATHHDDPDILETHVDDNLSYPFTEHPVLAFFDPAKDRVRVFAGTSEDAMPASDVVCNVLQPRLKVYLSQHDSHYEVTICALPMENIENTPHELKTLDPQCVTTVREIDLNEHNAIMTHSSVVITSNSAVSCGALLFQSPSRKIPGSTVLSNPETLNHLHHISTSYDNSSNTRFERHVK